MGIRERLLDLDRRAGVAQPRVGVAAVPSWPVLLAVVVALIAGGEFTGWLITHDTTVAVAWLAMIGMALTLVMLVGGHRARRK